MFNFQSGMNSEIRKKIDEIDDKLIVLLKERMNEVAKIEKRSSIIDPEREKEVLDKTSGPIRIIFKEIIKESRKLQEERFNNE